MKKLLYLLLLIPLNVLAATGSIKASVSSTNVTLNNTVTVTVKVSSTDKLGSWGFGISYDKSKLSLISGDQSVVGYGDGTFSSKSYTYKFKAIAVGSASVSVDNAKIVDWDSESSITTSTSNLTIKIKEPVVVNYSSDNNLKSLTIDGFELSPSFDKKTLEYSVTVLPETTSVKVNAIANDKTASIKGTGNIEVKEGLNEINLVVTAENGSSKTYVIRVTVPEKNPIVYKFKNGEYNILRKLPEEIPVGFSVNTKKFNNEDVTVVQNEKLNLTLLYLKKDDKTNFYIYNEKSDTVELYNELSNNDLKIYILNKEFIVDSLISSEIKINEQEVIGYRLTKNSNNYVIKGVNISSGKEDLYLYDIVNKTFTVFSIDDYKILISNNEIYKLVALGLSICSILLIIILILVNNSRKKLTKIIKYRLNEEIDSLQQTKEEKGEK